MKKLLLLSVSALALLSLTACSSDLDDMKSGKIETIDITEVHTDLDHEDVFAMFPMVTYVNKTPVTTFIPYYDKQDVLNLDYNYNGKHYVAKSYNFEFQHGKANTGKLKASDLGKGKVTVIVNK